MRSAAKVFLAGCACVLASLVGACAVAPGGASAFDSADYGLSVAADLRLAGTPQQVAACLRRRENSASYPQGVSPGATTTEIDGGAIRLTQWFFVQRGMTWTTRLVLRPAGDAATDVQVLLPIELTVSEGYRRAAVELIARCQARAAVTDG